MHIKNLRARRHDISNLLRHAETFDISKAGKLRLAWFAYALAHEGNVSLTCRYFGISRSTFLRWANRFDPKRPETLEERSRRPHRVRAPETGPEILTLIREYRKNFPTMGKEQIAVRIKAEHSLTVSASTVGRVISREKLFFGDLESHMHKRIGLDLSGGAQAARPAGGPSTRSGARSLYQGPASLASASEAGEAGSVNPPDGSKPSDEGLPSQDLPAFGS